MTAGAALKFGPSISVKLEAAVGEGDCVKCELLFALRNIYATPRRSLTHQKCHQPRPQDRRQKKQCNAGNSKPTVAPSLPASLLLELSSLPPPPLPRLFGDFFVVAVTVTVTVTAGQHDRRGHGGCITRRGPQGEGRNGCSSHATTAASFCRRVDTVGCFQRFGCSFGRLLLSVLKRLKCVAQLRHLAFFLGGSGWGCCGSNGG